MSPGLPPSMPPPRGADPAVDPVRPGVMAAVLSAVAGLIVASNLLVAAAVARLLLRKRRQSWCFVLNLAFADLLVGVAITGLATEDFGAGNAGPAAGAPPPEGRFRCLMRMALVMSPCTASMMSVFLISLDRYAAIKTPLRYSRLSGKGTAAASLLVLWLSALAIGFLPVTVRQLQADAYAGFCSFFAVVRKACLAVFSLCFFPVFAVFVYVYLDILKVACGHHRRIGLMRRAGSGRRAAGGCFWSHAKALRTVAALLGCFLLLWCPFFVAGVVELLCGACGLADLLQNYLFLLGLCNSVVNPLVYAVWQREVRLQLAAVFACPAKAGGPSRGRDLPFVVAAAGPGTPEPGRGSLGPTPNQHQLPAVDLDPQPV